MQCCFEQARDVVSLPEIIEHFGAELEELADSSVSIAESFAMLRMHLVNVDVRQAADLALKILDNILDHPNDPKLWKLNLKNEEMQTKLWRHEGGRALLKAIGFGDPAEVANDNHPSEMTKKGVQGAASKPPIGKNPGSINMHSDVLILKALAKNFSKTLSLPPDLLHTLRSRRYEIDQEIVALEGSPSVAAAIREMRVYHSVAEVRNGAETALVIIRNVLTQPKDLRMYRVKRSNPTFHRNLGRLRSSELLMHAIGFRGSGDNTATTDFGSSMGAGMGTLSTMGLSTMGGPTGHSRENSMMMSLSASINLNASHTSDSSLAFPKHTSAIYVLQPVSKMGFNASSNLAEGADPAKFKFPSLDAETEKFLWRRKADLELALRALDGVGKQRIYRTESFILVKRHPLRHPNSILFPTLALIFNQMLLLEDLSGSAKRSVLPPVHSQNVPSKSVHRWTPKKTKARGPGPALPPKPRLTTTLPCLRTLPMQLCQTFFVVPLLLSRHK